MPLVLDPTPDTVAEVAGPRCAASNRRKGLRCKRTATHDILLSCPRCGWDAIRHLCTPHAAKAENHSWPCGYCWTTILHVVVAR